MAFIRSPYFFEIGEIVEITKDLRVAQGTFTKGHRFRVNGTRIIEDGTQIATSIFCDETKIGFQNESGVENIRLVQHQSNNTGGRDGGGGDVTLDTVLNR